MGHLGNTKELYRKLQEKLDSYPIGIVQSEYTDRFLKLLFRPHEAELVSRMPLQPQTASALEKKLKIPAKELQEQLDSMAFRGLIFSIDRNDKRYYLPLWSVPGFVEMTMMRVRDDIPQHEIAHLMKAMWDERRFTEEVFREDTQFGRALIDEAAAQDNAEILPYELATQAIREAKHVAVALCYCRHEQEHLGNHCQYPMEICLAMNVGAEFAIQQKLGRQIETSEALDILAQTSSLGLMHIGDNVRNHLGFICNCCKCCCGILRAYHDHGIFNVVVKTRFIMTVDEQSCVGCGRCAQKCQLNAIEVQSKDGKKVAVVNQELCVGCGSCYRFCGKKALHLEKRPEKIITPEMGLEKMIMMAIERGKLQDVMFDDVYSTSHKMMRWLLKPILSSKWVKRHLLQEKTRAKIRRSLVKKFANSEYHFALES